MPPPSAIDGVLGLFHRHGFAEAAVVGRVAAAAGAPRLVVA